jgi:hypothetical protein
MIDFTHQIKIYMIQEIKGHPTMKSHLMRERFLNKNFIKSTSLKNGQFTLSQRRDDE